MDTFYLSDCAKRWHSECGAQVALMGITGSGWTHFIYVGYENLAQMEKGRGLLQCPDFLSMLVSIRKASNEEAYLSQVGDLTLQLRDWTKDAIFMKFDMRVKPGSEKDYAAAWTKYVESNASLNTGSAGLVGASNMPELVSNLQEIQSGESHKEFISVVGEIRDIRNQMFVQPLKGYQ